jgi:hypothetical protein
LSFADEKNGNLQLQKADFALTNGVFQSTDGEFQVFFGVCRVKFADFQVSEDDFGVKNGSLQPTNGVFEQDFSIFRLISVVCREGFCNKRRKFNKGAGVPLYDSIATYDSGVLYDDTSSPQPTRKRMAKVKMGLSRLTPDELVDLANTIKTAMTGNANFTTPNPTLAALGR